MYFKLDSEVTIDGIDLVKVDDSDCNVHFRVTISYFRSLLQVLLFFVLIS